MKAGKAPQLLNHLSVFIVFCLPFFQFYTLNAQDIKFTAITTHEGLSSNTINAILKDSYGYLWFATPEGVDRYDGRGTKTYHFKTSNAPVSQSNEADAL